MTRIPIAIGIDHRVAGIALFLTHLAIKKMKCSELRQKYPEYKMAKKKLVLDPSDDFNKILSAIKNSFPGHLTDERDGLWVETVTGWVQVRKSNTEPIIRIYSESHDIGMAENMASEIVKIVKKANKS